MHARSLLAHRIDIVQTLRASSALIKHIKTSTQEKEASSKARNLLAGDPSNTIDAEPLWLNLVTKKHIVPQTRLKPVKILLPHSINASPSLSICLIVPDPQRQFKDLVAHPAFPPELSKRITKVIGAKKLEKKYYSFESKRQLRDSHDLFFADDRIITYLAKTLGKTFYSTTPKRPIPIHLAARKDKIDKIDAALPSTKQKKKLDDPKSMTTPQAAASEIERTLSMAQINLSSSVNTSIRVGLSSQTPEQIAGNIEAVVSEMTEKYVPRQWKGVKAIHIKGPNTMALPIWLADELWDDDGMVLEDHEAEEAKNKAMQKRKRERRILKRDSIPAVEDGEKITAINKRKSESEELKEDTKKKKRRLEDEGLSQDMKERREKLREQKKAQRASNRLAESTSNVMMVKEIDT